MGNNHYDRISSKTREDIALLRDLGYTRKAAAGLMGLSEGRMRSICSNYGITGWPTGAASYDQTGENNHNFQGGLSRATVARTTKDVLTQAGRNLFTCERCGATREIELPRHHKNRDRADNHIDNLEVLCVPCHNREHMSEKTRDEGGRFNGSI